MDPITFLVVTAPILAVVSLFLCWNQPFFQNRLFRRGLGAGFLLLTAFCLFGTLASFELADPDGLAWRLRYLTLGSLTLLGAVYFFLKRPNLATARGQQYIY